MVLLAALLCNYGRGKCLIDIGTEGSFRIKTFRFSRVRRPASFNSRLFSCLLALRYSSRSVSKYCSRECMSILAALSVFLRVLAAHEFGYFSI
jgi:hypothetical protein